MSQNGRWERMLLSRVPRRVTISWCRGGRLDSNVSKTLFRRFWMLPPIPPRSQWRFFCIFSFLPWNIRSLISGLPVMRCKCLFRSHLNKAFPVYYTVPDLLLFLLVSLGHPWFICQSNFPLLTQEGCSSWVSRGTEPGAGVGASAEGHPAPGNLSLSLV